MTLRLLLLLPFCLAALAAEPDWPKIQAETLKHFQALIRMDTSDPPGNESEAANYVRQVLEAEGIPVKTFTKVPNRPNLVARLKGNGSKRPILIVGHTDVVNIDPSKWKEHGPFSADRAGGYIYGRGTVDDKDNLVSCLMTMVTLKRLGVILDRDVIFLAEAAEEGNSSIGAGFIADEHWAEIDAEFCLAEGGGAMRRGGKLISVNIMTSEKIPARAVLKTSGTAGHGSVPRLDNAIARLSSAVEKAANWQPPMKLNDTTRTYFERLATVSGPEQAARYNGLANPDRSAAIQEYMRANEPAHYSMLRTSISPTIFHAGYRNNVIPAAAEATLDIRALPGEDLDAFFAELKRKIGDDQVEIQRQPLGRPASPVSRLDTEMFKTLEAMQRKHYPGAVTLPSMLTGATDMSYFRAKGMQCYGVGPLLDVEELEKGYGAHSDQERILEDELYRFLRFQYDAVVAVSAHN
ncbi:M20/M25/M40 family metallo-hydrolase [Paludibaculum fermentans]|uniref:M20/M25/M40 family metallo-hydrolase n=1 Tax=Paludibaculum fermentans TaxID=1473598 RepID=A0A7S7NTY1_PALFE|nr:M20/M25/M40 family metallo-hydrolase [Paludibaculum fermentans]QOY89763.1 M20/M25/M40 family metallo-hydrolase [Paludibaculum fermentans]